ncbi:MAG: hypothetical protein WC480_02250 [Patescibacteria group bacterium]
MEKRLVIIVVILILAAVFVFWLWRNSVANNPGPVITNDINQSLGLELDLGTLGSLNACNPQYVTPDTQGRFLDCSTLPQELVCNYYKIISSSGQEMITNLTYNNPCFLCQFYGPTGQRSVGSATYINWGYLTGECPTSQSTQ